VCNWEDAGVSTYLRRVCQSVPVLL
jgi:hypothetical protein